jgi:hypothetical protein
VNEKNSGGLDKNIQLGKGEEDNTLVYRNQTLDIKKYKGFYVEPGEIYAGDDADFGDRPADEKAELAKYLSDSFIQALGKEHNVVSQPGPGIVKLHLILAGYKTSRPALSTALRLMPVGLAVTLGRSAAGAPASFTGSATYSCQITDSQTGEVLAAYMTKQSPAAYDLTSGLGETRAVRLAIDQGAEEFVKAVDRLKGKTQ